MKRAALGAVVVLAVPAALWAAVTVPNMFTPGTTISSSEVNANFAVLAAAVNTKQDLIGAGCPAGHAVREISPGGAVTCDPVATGDVTSVVAGPGLTGGGTAGDVTLGAQFGGTGSADTVARSDHSHLASYVHWGLATCPVGPLLYSGFAAAVGRGSSKSAPMCLDGAFPTPGFVYSNDIAFARFDGTTNGARVNTPGSSFPQVTCAVCDAPTFERFGVGGCPAGYATVYTGFVGGIIENDGDHTNGPVCLDAAVGAGWTNSGTPTSVWVFKSASDRAVVDQVAVPCAVCTR